MVEEGLEGVEDPVAADPAVAVEDLVVAVEDPEAAVDPEAAEEDNEFRFPFC